MDPKIVDCIILAMLKEERELFLQANTCLIYDKTKIRDDFLEFEFFDKDNNLRTGVFCSFDREMGINAASRLVYLTSRKYHSELCINIGVAGYIDEVSIGDVIIVDDIYTLCENNVANEDLQKNNAMLDRAFIRTKVCNPLERKFTDIFKAQTAEKLDNLRMKLSQYIRDHNIDVNLAKSLTDICSHKVNKIKLGSCATYHSVVKDENTRAAIKAKRKTNVVDMEAYYFNDWHKLIRTEEYENSLKNSKIIFFKSISDTAIKEEKEILEKIQSRYIAMSNIYDVVSFFISNVYEFSRESKSNLLEYFESKICKKYINKLVNYTNEACAALDSLCPHIIINEKIGDVFINGNYLQVVCDILEKPNQILVLEGNPGKGKSTFISYVYKKITEKKSAVFISIPEMVKKNNQISAEQALYLFDRLLKSNKDIIVFIDGVEGSRQEKSEDNKKLLESIINKLNKYGNRNVSLCIGAWHTNDVIDIKRDILTKINSKNEINTLTFKSVSSLDNSISDFISKFAEFYKYSEINFNTESFVKDVFRIVNNTELQLKYVDFRLLHIFAKNNKVLKESNNIFEFISSYCNSKITDRQYGIMQYTANVFKRVNLTDEYGLLTTNIYSRAFLIAEFIYYAFVNNKDKYIRLIINNKFVLSDNINLFLEYLLNTNASNAKAFVESVLNAVSKRKNCSICSKIQLLYNISSIKNLSSKKKSAIKSYIIEEIERITNCNLLEQESDDIIAYRTLAIILNNKFNTSEYLEKFNKLLSDEFLLEETDMLKKINRNFHLLYYSQMEFTYDKVEDDVLFETEIVWNTLQVLKNNISSNKYNKAYIDTCRITLSQLISYIKQKNLLFLGALSDKSLEVCEKLIEQNIS